MLGTRAEVETGTGTMGSGWGRDWVPTGAGAQGSVEPCLAVPSRSEPGRPVKLRGREQGESVPR